MSSATAIPSVPRVPHPPVRSPAPLAPASRGAPNARLSRPSAESAADTVEAPDVCVRDAATLSPLAVHVRRLGGYTPDGETTARDVLAVDRPDESILVVDCLAGTLADARLIAHLMPEEPVENARIVSEMYLADETTGRCRRLSAEDLRSAECSESPRNPNGSVRQSTPLLDSSGRLYLLHEVPWRRSVYELRWGRAVPAAPGGARETVALRDVVAALEDYEPARTITAVALAATRERSCVSTRRLREEARRLERSPIVLNRRLREAVERHVAAGLTMSQIAMRCGRSKRDRGGSRSGETSWLARRIGQMPEGGDAEPTPWVHSDTLALIARDGLGLSPHEVEL